MAPSTGPSRDILSVLDFAEELPRILRRAVELKRERARGRSPPLLRGKSVALVFEKSSTRTRTSFEVGVHDLGGHAVYLSSKDLQLGRGETIADTARVLSRYVDAIVYRAFRHENEVELARWAAVPVINALDDLEHPCQIAADLQTLYERWKGEWAGRRLAYIGDGNNVLHSLLYGVASLGIDFAYATPSAYAPRPEVLAKAKQIARAHGSEISGSESVRKAALGADALYTDVWVSMGDEEESAARERVFQGYQVNDELLALAKPDAFVLHDLPAHRGQEITDAVLDGPRAAAWDQAENRLHAQKALLEWVFHRAPRSGRARGRR